VGNHARGVGVQIATTALCGILEFDAADGVIRVAAGTRLSEVEAEVGAAGWELAIDPPGPESTVGGALACAAEGPRRTAYGRPRQLVLGLDTVLATGERTRCGGRVVKNVTGYDLAKLHVGAYGTLGVIESAWLRLRPRPQETAVRVAMLPDTESGHRLALELARRPSARVAALLCPALARRSGVLSSFTRDSGQLLVCELGGDAAVCREDARWLDGRAATEVAGGEAIDALRALQGGAPPSGLRARLHVVPSSLAPCSRALRAAGASLLAHPEPGVVYAYFAAPADERAGAADGDRPAGGAAPWLTAALSALERARDRAGGTLVLEEIPDAARPGRDVFGDAADMLPVMRALKDRFDPGGVLNPGRFVGGI
jgi:glycolate oxidase FAD binding subunit